MNRKEDNETPPLYEQYAHDDVHLTNRVFPRGIGNFFTSTQCRLCNVELAWKAPREARCEHQASSLHVFNYERYKYAFSKIQLDQATDKIARSTDSQEKERLRLALVDLLAHPPDLHTLLPTSYSDC